MQSQPLPGAAASGAKGPYEVEPMPPLLLMG
jgi:hypothetical protein